jgi:hypothetical protein
MNNNINLSNNVATSPLNNVVQIVSDVSAGRSWLYVFGILALIVAVAVGYVYVTYKDSPWFAERAAAGWLTWDWFRAEPKFGLSASGTLKETAPAPAVLPPSAPVTTSISERTGAIKDKKKPETWCFVGEDLAGRWCVAVPKPDLCPRERAFASRSDCELTPANHMPAGLIQNNGVSMLPLAKASIA